WNAGATGATRQRPEAGPSGTSRPAGTTAPALRTAVLAGRPGHFHLLVLLGADDAAHGETVIDLRLQVGGLEIGHDPGPGRHCLLVDGRGIEELVQLHVRDLQVGTAADRELRFRLLELPELAHLRIGERGLALDRGGIHAWSFRPGPVGVLGASREG